MFSILFLLLSMLMFFFSMVFIMWDYSLILEFILMKVNSMNLIYIMVFDWMSLSFLSVVFFISSMVIFYSKEYMSDEIFQMRFIILVFMFVMSMVALIISPNLISILLGWDGLGLVSYCLVIYYQNVKSFNAGMLTALSNRIGDVALLMAIAWMMNFGSWNFLFYLEVMKSSWMMELISYLVILAAMTKSAQIPFSSWLPAAMAAPTPVSSLVHSSTLVTAGVYLLIRFNFAFTDNMLNILLIISCLTMFMSGVGANFEFDLKKIIALSTLSQLGLMMSSLALGLYKLAFFHLLVHALFKALLFMCAGSIIHNLNNNQDIRYMGGLIKLMPLSCTYFNICNWSLCGFPFMAGFYSKDLIVELMSMSILNIFIYLIFYISIGLTVAYSFRLSYYLMVNNFNFWSLNMIIEHKNEMLKGMMGLIYFSIIGGSLFSWMIFPTPFFICLPFSLKIMTLILILTGLLMSWEISKLNLLLNFFMFGQNFKSFLGMMWNMPVLSTYWMNSNFLIFSSLFYQDLDLGWFEFYGAQNLKYFMKKNSIIQLLSLNYFKIYLFLTLIWIFFIFIYM